MYGSTYMYNMIQLYITVCLGQYSHKPRHFTLYTITGNILLYSYLQSEENILNKNICTVPLGGVFDHNHRLFLTTDTIFRVSAYLLLGFLTLLDLCSVVVSLVVSCGLSGTFTGPGALKMRPWEWLYYYCQTRRDCGACHFPG